jgi:hypothetical protein
MNNFIPGSTPSVICFVLLVIAVLGLILKGSLSISKEHLKKTLIFLILWIAFFSVVAVSGVLEKYTIPALPITFLILQIGAVLFASSKHGEGFTRLPLYWLVGFQAFRLPLELVLHTWSTTQTVPETMTWTGQNFDIISGILALGAFVPKLRNKTYFWIVNISGIILLLNVIRVVVMSSGLPFSWPLERSLQLALYLPYAYIAVVCVWAALAGHIIMTRALLRKDK